MGSETMFLPGTGSTVKTVKAGVVTALEAKKSTKVIRSEGIKKVKTWVRLLGKVQHDSLGLICHVEGTFCSLSKSVTLSVFLCVYREKIVLKRALRSLSQKGESD